MIVTNHDQDLHPRPSRPARSTSVLKTSHDDSHGDWISGVRAPDCQHRQGDQMTPQQLASVYLGTAVPRTKSTGVRTDGPLTAKPYGSETPHSFVIANRGSEEGIMEYNEGEKDCG